MYEVAPHTRAARDLGDNVRFSLKANGAMPYTVRAYNSKTDRVLFVDDSDRPGSIAGAWPVYEISEKE